MSDALEWVPEDYKFKHTFTESEDRQFEEDCHWHSARPFRSSQSFNHPQSKGYSKQLEEYSKSLRLVVEKMVLESVEKRKPKKEIKLLKKARLLREENERLKHQKMVATVEADHRKLEDDNERVLECLRELVISREQKEDSRMLFGGRDDHSQGNDQETSR